MKLRDFATRFRRDQRGVAAIEFVIVAPVLMLVLAGTADVGMAVLTRINVNEGVSAAANAALVSGAALSSSNADVTATAMAAILQRTRGFARSEATYEITFNGGRTYEFVGGKGTATGTASAADECRCPTQRSSVVIWGGKIDCSSPCPNNSLAGRYVSIDVHQPYTPMFPQFGLISKEGIHVQTFALVQ